MKAITELLPIFEQRLSQYFPEAFSRLNPGLSKEQIDDTISSNKLDFTDDVYSYFEWKNGISHENIKSTDQLLLFPNGIPFTLAEAVHDYEELAIKKSVFESNYFPLFNDGNESFLLINLDPDAPDYNMISLCSPKLYGDAQPITIYDSFASMLETAITAFDQKAVWISDGSLESDSDSYYQVASEINPNSDYWQYD